MGPLQRTKIIRTISMGISVCDLDRLKSGELTRELNLLDPGKVWTWDPSFAPSTSRLSEKAAPYVAPLSRRALSPHSGVGPGKWYP